MKLGNLPHSFKLCKSFPYTLFLNGLVWLLFDERNYKMLFLDICLSYKSFYLTTGSTVDLSFILYIEYNKLPIPIVDSEAHLLLTILSMVL